MHTQQDVIETLKQAKNLIETKGHTKGAFARDSEGWTRQTSSSDAVCFCSMGALYRSADELFPTRFSFAEAVVDDAADYLENSYDGPQTVPQWNDAPSRTREEVLHTFSLAIQLAEADLIEQAAEVLPGVAANTAGVTEVA